MTQQDAIHISVDAVDDAAWALGYSLYDPIELVTAARPVDEPGESWFAETREVKTILIARLITMGPRPGSPPVTVRRLMKLARQTGFTRDSRCPRHPEIVPLADGWPHGPITASLDAHVTADRHVAVLAAEPNRPADRRRRASKPGTKLIATLLAWPTPAGAAALIQAYAPEG